MMSADDKRAMNEMQRLAQICRKEETNLLIGKLELTLNQSLIELLYNDLNSSNNCNINNVYIKYNYLRKLFRKIPSVKIIGDNKLTADSDTISLRGFESCVSLQLIRIAFKRVVALQTIRSQVKSLNCLKCFDTYVLDQEFWDLFGVWPQLSALNFSHNNIVSLNELMIPSTVNVLDLSWNRIQVFNNVESYSAISLTKLDLSYNCLTQVPKLSSSCCQSLESLFLRGNLIESIEGIDKFEKLAKLDVALNCLMDLKTIISCLKTCKSLRSLWIGGNPFACHKNCFEIITKEMPFLTKLNEIVVNRDRDQQNIITFDNKTVVLGKEVSNSKSDDECELFFDASCDSMDSSARSDAKSKTKKLRVVEIKEQTEELDEEVRQLVVKPNESNDKKYENLSEAKEMIQKRNELGDEWLISWRPSLQNSSFFAQIYENKEEVNTSIASDLKSINLDNNPPPVAESTPKVDRKQSTESTHTNDDDIEILSEETSEWTHKELENDMNIIIVENMDTNETIFVYVDEKHGLLFEKDFEGKVLRNHDLKVLTNVEIINDLALKIFFDSRVTSKREVKYQFDCIESCLEFNEKFIIPWFSKSKQIISEEHEYECLKCGNTKLSSSHVICCPICGSDAIMKMNDEKRKRRSGSDITILSQANVQNQTQLNTSDIHENNVWEELFSINSSYDDSFFTRVEHTLKLYIEVKLFEASSGDDEEIEGLVKCKAMTDTQNRLESSYLVISNKNILILTVDENQDCDNFDVSLKLNISKPISAIMQLKEFPHLLTNQGFWIEFNDEPKQTATKPQSKSKANRFGSKRPSIAETNDSCFALIVFYDEIIGKTFIKYFNETIGKLVKIPTIRNTNQNVLIDNNIIAVNDDMVVVNIIKSANYKRIDMKSDLILEQNIALIITEELVILGEFCFHPNNDYIIKILYKEYIINLMPEIYVNLKQNCMKLLFTDTDIETHFEINLFTSDVIKKSLIPIKSQWEKAFDVSMTFKKM